MTPTLHYVVYAAIVTVLFLLFSSMLRNREWTLQGLKLSLGNRDQIPLPSPIAGRADRAAMNTLENFAVFAALALTAHVAGLDNKQAALGAAVFFWARIIYLFVYVIGVPYLRSAVWLVGQVGLGVIAVALL